MSYFRSDIEAMSGYVPGEQPQDSGWVKLNTNENPYPPSPAALTAAQEELTNGRLYPDPGSKKLRTAAAELYGLTAEEVIAGNGSDDLLNLLIRATCTPGQTVAAFYPSYTLYRTLAEIQGADYQEIPFADRFAVPEELDLSGVRILFLPNPNAPTGTMIDHDTIRRLCAACPGLVVIDEAYTDFAEQSALPLLKECDNMVITRTFSKSYSLAGMRVGLAFASAEIISQLMKVKDSYNLDRVAQAAATAALCDQATLRKNVDAIIATRNRMTERLAKLGVVVYPSQANFVLALFETCPARDVFAALKERRILVRYFDAPGLDDCLRISVGTEEECDTLLDALTEILA